MVVSSVSVWAGSRCAEDQCVIISANITLIHNILHSVCCVQSAGTGLVLQHHHLIILVANQLVANDAHSAPHEPLQCRENT